MTPKTIAEVVPTMLKRNTTAITATFRLATTNGFQHNSQAHLPTQDTSAAILAHALNATPTPNAQATNAASNAMGGILKEVYILYADYVLKNPFYELEMPIRCELFDQKVAKLNR